MATLLGRFSSSGSARTREPMTKFEFLCHQLKGFPQSGTDSGAALSAWNYVPQMPAFLKIVNLFV